MKVLILKMLGRDETGRADEATVTIQVAGEDEKLYISQDLRSNKVESLFRCMYHDVLEQRTL